MCGGGGGKRRGQTRCPWWSGPGALRVGRERGAEAEGLWGKVAPRLRKLVCDSSERRQEERGRAGGSSARRAHGNNFETRARLESEVLGWGGRVCGPAAGSSGDCPPAALFVRRRAAPFRALQSVRGGLSALRSDKAEWAAGRPRRRSFLRRCEGLLRLGRLRRRGWASSGGSVPGAAA